MMMMMMMVVMVMMMIFAQTLTAMRHSLTYHVEVSMV